MPDIFIAEHKNSTKEAHEEKLEEVPSSNQRKHEAGKKTNVLSAFCIEPVDITFADQEKDEKVLLFLRRHLITNLDWLLLAIFFSIIPLFFGFLNISVDINLFNFLNFPPRFTLLFLFFYYSVVLTFGLVNFASWFYNVGIITTRRVVDIDLVELVYKNISTTKFELIQDTSYIQNGPLRSIFHYGDVIVQTAGQHGNFEIEAVPNPEKVVHLIENYIGEKNES